MLPEIDSGSGGSLDDEEDDDPISTTSFSGGTIDLGYSGADGGSNQTFDFEETDAAVVDTQDDIADAGGPEGVLVGTEDQARDVKDAVSEVTGTLRDAASSDDSGVDSGGDPGGDESDELPAPAENPAGDADGPPVDLDDLPIGGIPGLPSFPSVGDIGGRAVAIGLAGLAGVALVFGGGD